MKAGVLALQGDVREHVSVLQDLGAAPVLVRTAEELASVDCLAIPGGESTTMAKLAHSHGLVEPLRERAENGMPVFGTCAGMIIMAREVTDGEPLLSLLDISVTRNAYGRQVDSFEADVDAPVVSNEPLRAVFIRAPVVDAVGDGVEVLAELRGSPILVEQRNLIAATFHPELAGDGQLHRRMLERVG